MDEERNRLLLEGSWDGPSLPDVLEEYDRDLRTEVEERSKKWERLMQEVLSLMNDLEGEPTPPQD